MSNDEPRASRPAQAVDADVRTIGAFLRGLAERVERDPAFGRQVAQLLAESRLLQAAAPASAAAAERPGRARRAARASMHAPEAASASPADPFALLRDAGEDGARRALAAQDVPALRQIIRLYRLDPARISARWTSRERLVDLIITQVRARADHGKFFARL